MQLFTVTTVLLTLFHRIISDTWNYADLGPDVWSDTYPLCAGQSQSPIDIKTACTTYRSWIPFQFSSAYSLAQNFTLTNNGHNIVATYNGSGSSPFVLKGGGLDSGYGFVNFHLHWGQNYKSSSEHQVNGVKYAGEIHFVHSHSETGTTAVLGMFIQSSKATGSLDSTTNATAAEWARYFAAAQNLEVTNNATVLSLNLGLLMGNNLNDFWRYQGSLTTPPCTEGVIWTVFRTPIVFTEDELNSFRTNIFSEDYRILQPLNNRMVYRSFPDQIFSSISDYNCCSNNLAYNSANRFFKRHVFQLVLFFGIIITFEYN